MSRLSSFACLASASTDDDRAVSSRTGFDVGFDLQASRLVVIQGKPAGFDIALNFQTNRLIVIRDDPARFDVSFDFHIFPSPYDIFR